MRAVGYEVCDGINVGVDLDWCTLKDGSRYRDKRPVAKKMWETIMEVLVSIGAISLKDAS
jgi:hypothetical protein